ncbi:hypothetical protein Tco_1231656 [Tanacetum coccineum]
MRQLRMVSYHLLLLLPGIIMVRKMRIWGSVRLLLLQTKVKLHGIPLTAFSEDGLSVIATKLGTPLMLDSYTSDLCMQS